MNILITGIGGATPRSIARHIRRIYPNTTIISTDLHKKALGFHMSDLVDYRYIVPRSSHEDYWSMTKKIIEKHNVDFAFIQPEKEVIAWGKYYEENGTFPCPVLIPPRKLAAALINKARMSELLEGTEYIPKTIKFVPGETSIDLVEKEIGYPCWIRATEGSGGLGSLKLNRSQDLEAWLFIHENIKEYTISEFLTGRHLANQMLYINGECVKNAALECAEYVMADIAPSKVTGNTSYGRLINDDNLLKFCEECIDYIAEKLDVVPHGVLSFDLKEDAQGNYKVTEVNIRHMAYTGVMSSAGFDLINDTILLLQGQAEDIKDRGYYQYDKDYIFLRDVDIEPILMTEEGLINSDEL